MNIPLSTDDKLEIIYQFCLWHMRDDLRDMNNWEDSRLPNDEAAVKWYEMRKKLGMLRGE